jgi:Chromate transporter
MNRPRLAVMIGYRFAGCTGAAASVAGLVGGPFAIMIALGLLYRSYGELPLVQHALSGMSAVAVGLMLAETDSERVSARAEGRGLHFGHCGRAPREPVAIGRRH